MLASGELCLFVTSLHRHSELYMLRRGVDFTDCSEDTISAQCGVAHALPRLNCTLCSDLVKVACWLAKIHSRITAALRIQTATEHST